MKKLTLLLCLLASLLLLSGCVYRSAFEFFVGADDNIVVDEPVIVDETDDELFCEPAEEEAMDTE